VNNPYTKGMKSMRSSLSVIWMTNPYMKGMNQTRPFKLALIDWLAPADRE